MKRKSIITAVLPVLVFLFALQGCTKYGSNPPIEHFAFSTPEIVSPANEAYTYTTASTVDLTWASVNESGDPVKADVYFGTSDNPPLYKADHNALTLSVPIEKGVTYFWRVVMKDANGITTPGPTWSFTPLCPFVASMAVGSYHAVSPPDQWNSAGNITLTADPNDPYAITITGIEAIEGQTEDGGPLVMHIDPVTHEITVPKVVIVSFAFDTYHNLAYGGTGVYNACDGSYAMEFDISATEGNFGTFAFFFTRNP
jgi:hypothetical protein